MNTKTLSILSKIANTTALTGNTQEIAMNTENNNPFPANWLEANETPTVLTVTRGGRTVEYIHCTQGSCFLDTQFPSNDGGRWPVEVRNIRDWDYKMRELALNGRLQLGDIIEVGQPSSSFWTARYEVEFFEVAPWWSRSGVRQPVENVLVTVGLKSCRHWQDRGGWHSRFTGTTDPITGQVEPDLSRW